MILSDYDYELPPELIASSPAQPRDHSRLMVIDRTTGVRQHHHFYELTQFLRSGDVLVLNSTRVIPARLTAHNNERSFEVFLLKTQSSLLEWRCLVRPAKKLRNQPLIFHNGVTGSIERVGEGQCTVKFSNIREERMWDWLAQAGDLPIPPYLKRPTTSSDAIDYQTVYAKQPGSVAAPTAGLHFTPALIDHLRAKGIQIEEVCLHVGYGTFAPLREDSLKKGALHEEEFEVFPSVFARLKAAKNEGRRIIAVGTTTCRTLESMNEQHLNGPTTLFIRPGYRFRWVDGLITNFHLPQSSLLVLVTAFLGLEKTKASYRDAIERSYRFYSYGDSMLIL